MKSPVQVYLKKVALSLADAKKKKRQQIKYPQCSTFHTRSKKRNLLILPQQELRKLARLSGKILVGGYNHVAKVCTEMDPSGV